MHQVPDQTKKAISKGAVISFLLLLSIDIGAIAAKNEVLHYIVKPLLMPFLIFLFLNAQRSRPKKPEILILAGLVFSWAGDVFLLFDQNGPAFFIAGLTSFLLTHILYIGYFLNILSRGKTGKSAMTWVELMVAAFGILLLVILWKGLGVMKVPVIIYATCICMMCIFSLRSRLILPGYIWKWFASGAVLFVISDSILAINKFLVQNPIFPPAIMFTYGIAQLFIVAGAIRLFQAKSDAVLKPAE